MYMYVYMMCCVLLPQNDELYDACFDGKLSKVKDLLSKDSSANYVSQF